jgi:hypothetical protein
MKHYLLNLCLKQEANPLAKLALDKKINTIQIKILNLLKVNGIHLCIHWHRTLIKDRRQHFFNLMKLKTAINPTAHANPLELRSLNLHQ